ncbi:TolC family outer membrane protein [Massilia sp. G4R7]|uniref:TolC family outer membrane protein n=1 Tax=Massilia phyllostachyos TaxID=2898585 RepID=A0ABS8Q146_9BURK|nr:TolC family outer membrane protein [Massilia phyllostachyos]MCD2515304.1 TolC family outer membrane protein [Massilia phyllostachyos]
MSATRRIPARLRALAVAAAALVVAGQAGAVTLQQAYEAALKNDPTYRMGIQANEAAKENRILGRSQLLPSVSASYSRNKNVVDQELTDPRLPAPILSHPRYASTSAALQLRQSILNLDAVQRYRQGKVQTEAGAEQFKVDTNEVAVRVLTAYLDALFAEDQLALSRVQRDMYAEQQKVNERLFEKGEGTRTDMLETKARLDLAEAQLIEAQDQAVVQRNVLEGIIGGPAGKLDQLSEAFRVGDLIQGSFEEWSKRAIDNSHELQVARLGVENARLEIGRIKAGHAPRIDFVATYSKGDNETINTLNQDNLNRSLGVQINFPIYQGGAINAQTRQAAANYERARADLDARTDKLLVEVRRAHSLVQSSVRKVDALVKATESAKLLMTATEQSIKGGVRINLDLLNAQQQLFIGQRDLAQARYAYLIAVLRLRAFTGEVGSEDIRAIAAYFRS